MPELPEVEIIRRGLEKYLTGKAIKKFEIKDPKLIQDDINSVIGEKIVAVKRFGKGLVIELLRSKVIAVHIKLTGQLIYQGEENKNTKPSKEKVGELPSKFTRAIIYLSPQGKLYFNDVRRFAWMKIIKKDKLKNLEFFKNLGPEPFKDLTFEKFENLLKSSSQKIKALLMDQKKLAGVGNIYANEALFEAKINPFRKANELEFFKIKTLYRAILKVLKEGLKHGGTTEINFVDADGQPGKFQEKLKVYGRKDKPCINCGSLIKYARISGRSTFYCPECQK